MEKKDFILGKIYHAKPYEEYCAKWYYIGPDPSDHNMGYFKLVGIEKETVVPWPLSYGWEEVKQPLKGKVWLLVYKTTREPSCRMFCHEITMKDFIYNYKITPLVIKEVSWEEGEGVE